MASPNFEVQVAAVRQLTDRVREYLLISVNGRALPTYSAGSHIAVHTHSPEKGLIVRHYSLVGGPDLQDDARNIYRIAVQREDHARGSAHIHATFEIGTRLHIGPPINNFPLDRRDKNVLLIAGGIGITPIFSMARSLARRRCDYRVFYSGRNAGSMAYHDALHQLAGERAHFHHSDSHGQPDLLALLSTQPEGTSVYICGPKPMIDAAHAAGAALGWAAERVRSEMFTASISGDAKPFEVHLQRSNRTVHVGSNVSILDALLADGVPVLWDCRRGECGLCPLRVIKAEGGIEHHDHYLTTEEKATDESLCICVSRARGTSLVLDA
ncbi:PDR/VanB family oxidoreductase [Comamonas thiooxydans]|uniref:PDR/VanB family oxidoreductase n=1 Tax=Comamonas thiooxydans TaxID=363952 RepID=UPI000B353DBF|nr:PDR/VanB family oxidoreductase [Comamonas thiooxydans]BDR09182.1 PDR/VanB family oxidoreductase [Comamonas thiooxydans]